MHDWSDAEHHVERAHQLYEAGRWDEAEAALRQALALQPDRAEWQFNLGLTLEAAGKTDLALRAFTDAHDLAPDDAQILIVVGVTCLRLDRPRDAVAWLDKAQRLDPARPEPYIHRIEAYTRLDEHDQAEIQYYLALHCRDHREKHREEGRDESPGAAPPASEAADDGGAEASSLGPADHAMALANLAESLIARGLFEKAIWCLREASHLDPSAPHVHARMASAYASTGRHERARQLYLRELRDRPGCIDTLLDLGALLVSMGRFTEAGEKFRRVLELESDCLDAHFALGDLAARQGLDRDAVAAFTVVHRLDPDFVGVRRRLAELALRRRDPAEARIYLEAEVRCFRDDSGERSPRWSSDELRDLGRLLLDAGMPGEARDVFAALAAQDPSDPVSLHHLGVACFQSADRAGGIAATRASLRLDASRIAAMHNLALAALEAGDLSRAAVWLRRGLAVDPDDHSLRRLRAVLRVRRLSAALGRLAARALSPVQRGVGIR